ncbi:hypothetical protein D3C72_1705060 [compost metagenome]
MAHGRHWFVGIEEMAYRSQNGGVVAQVLGPASAGNDQGVIAFGLDVGKRCVQGEIVARLFAVGLRAFEVVNGGLDLVAGFLVGADGMHGVAHRQQRLEGHHGFIVFAVVAADHQDFLRCHG